MAVFAWVPGSRLKWTCAWPGFRVQCDQGKACQEMKDAILGRRQQRPIARLSQAGRAVAFRVVPNWGQGLRRRQL